MSNKTSTATKPAPLIWASAQIPPPIHHKLSDKAREKGVKFRDFLVEVLTAEANR